MPWLFALRILGPIALAVAVWTHGFSVGKAGEQRAWEKDKAARIQSAFEMSERARAKDAEQFATITRVANEAETKLVRSRTAAIADAAVVDGVRNETARLAIESASASCESIRQRDARILGLFAESSELLAEGLARVERLDARISGLQSLPSVCVKGEAK